MPASLALPPEETQLSIPPGSGDLEGFRLWTRSGQFPEWGRIDYLGGNIDINMSPEDLYTHGAVKTALAAQLHFRIAEADRGLVLVDRGRISNPFASLSVEPDIVVALWSSLAAGRVREIASARQQPGRFIELEGSPDLVVEVVSDGSLSKDTRRLPKLYAAAGIPEFWLVDARGEELSFLVYRLVGKSYELEASDALGWSPSALLGTGVRLSRRASTFGRPTYRLELASQT